MKIYHGVEQFHKLKYAVVTSGTFDGVHLGHQKIIEKLKNLAREKEGETVIITFWPHPKHVLFPHDVDLKILTTFEEKAELLDKLGVDHLIKIPFTKEFSQLTSGEFVQDILVKKINTRALVIGYDHRFGRNREGSFEHLKANADKYGFRVEEISRQDVDNIGVSSTKIRKALLAGELKKANKYLGRDYAIQGIVTDGNKLGRQMGYPTANIKVDDDAKLIPADGIYAVRVKHRGRLYNGMLSIGVRPTIGESERTIEVNIFDFDQEIYGDELTVFFVEKFREEKKFDSLDELKEQLRRDWEIASQILSKG